MWLKDSTDDGSPSILLRASQVPEHFKELYIDSGYRPPRSSTIQCLRSLFQPTNETLNVWTHLLPGLYFLYRFLNAMETMKWSPDDPYSWPMLVCLATAAIYTLASAMAHMFNVLSDEARHICFFCDYACVSLFGQGATVAGYAYSMPTSWMTSSDWRGAAYLPLSMLFSMWSVYVSCKTRFMPASLTRKLLRLGAFALPYLFDNLPVFFRLAVTSSPSEALIMWSRHYIIAAIAAFLYVSHIPERLFPGRFDIVGHSHQLFHSFAVMSTYYHLAGLTEDMNSRKQLLVDQGHWPTPETTYICVGVVGLMNAIIVVQFVKCVLHAKKFK